MNSVYKNLISTYNNSNDLFEYLKSEAGGKLFIDTKNVSETNPFAMIRYRKGESNFSVEHVKYFRSVVWNVQTNRPVSVTPPKSNNGESMPIEDINNFNVSTFIDGVMIAQFYDGTKWNIHTRSTLGAKCRYYSNEKTFAEMFEEAKDDDHESKLDIKNCYTFILQHPENRIVTSVSSPKLKCVAVYKIEEDNTITTIDLTTITLHKPNQFHFDNWPAINAKLIQWNELYKYNFQGFVMINKLTQERFKIRTDKYKEVRLIRQNTPRRDFVWLSEWSKGYLKQYLKIYPEETIPANELINKYKTFSSEVFKIYSEVFKARTMEKKDIPMKYRLFVYGLHKHYHEILKPSGKSVSWNDTREFMNTRDIPMMLFGINYDYRIKKSEIQIEPSHIHSETNEHSFECESKLDETKENEVSHETSSE